MQVLIPFVTCLAFAGVCTAAEFDPFEGPEPLLIFIQSDPWTSALGSDTPRVAIYENGDVIFTKNVGGRRMYHRAALDHDGITNVRQRLAPVLSLDELQSWYDIRPNVTDQPTAMFYVRDEDREIATSVRGLMLPDTSLPAFTDFRDSGAPAVPPEALLELHKWLGAVDYANSEEWTPKYLEVMFWDYSYAPDASIRWPEDWPSLDSERASKRGDIYSVFLDGSLLVQLRQFLATRKEKGAVDIGGKKMAVSYRYIFPHEGSWMEAFARD